MVIKRLTHGLLALTVFLFSQRVVAQGSLSVLDAKNGFRDAKFGMPLSAFKGMVPTGVTSVSADGNKTVSYKRTSDALRIGDINLVSIEYTFYNGRLYVISIISKNEDRSLLYDTFNQAYGRPRPFVRSDNPDLYDLNWQLSKVKTKGSVWDGNKVIVTMLIGQPMITMASKTVGKEVARHEAEYELKLKRKRAADL